ncbi:uncharacterized protein PV07_07237 [Cladophialophora immunda]|uniref:Spindle pole body-associated protein cut12 domain-containing protein n=1 Tax=Cladophialophora immunda TaxID=569365 RepID=A0A0D2CV33_9EURO|nr:uncharacterized protein PV07_07237 [Cladophialophora immunda]KIW27504.1 hypothetical protein PV07_07237 [Cladophialophora immunda]
MPGEDTILEGPVTPAPVFAYRAIRSIFFASPESSPEHGNKENLVPAFPSSPKRIVPFAENSPQPSPSPSQKRKREGHTRSGGGTILSPTKGILRTPGLATPRAKYLKDINVKFKSVSPEAPKLVTLPVSPRQRTTKVRDPPAALYPSKSSIELTSPTKTNPTPVSQNLLQHEQLPAGGNHATEAAPPTSPCLLSRAAIEAYITQTEKEMKKLVRYGQKMREYARKKDAENQELKGMIEQLRRENERLSRGADGAPGCRPGTSGLPQAGREVKDKEEEKRAGADVLGTDASPALRNRPPGYVREEVDRVETTVRSQAVKVPKDVRHSSLSKTASIGRSAGAGICEPSKPSGPSRSISSDHPPAIKRSISTTPTSKRTPSSSARSFAAVPSKQPPSMETDPATTSVRSASASASASASTVAARPGLTRLPPERVAAARDRIRRRTEARKASVLVEIEVVSALDKQGEDGHAVQGRQLPMETIREQEPLAKQLEEPSEVDWANL